MALQFRQGPNSDRLSITPAQGEPIWITDTKELWIGDGSTAGGVAIGGAGPSGDSDQALYTTSSVQFAQVQIGPNSGNKIRIVSNSVSVESTTSIVLVTQNGVAIEGDTPGNANLYVDKIQARVSAGTVTVLNTATFDKPVTIEDKLTVGSGLGDAIITSNSSTSLKLRTNDLSPTGTQIQMNQASIQAQVVEGGFRSLYTLSTGTAQFNSNTYDFENQNGDNLLTFDSNGSTHYGNYHNFGNTDAAVQINTNGTGGLTLCSGSDANDTGYVRTSKTDVKIGGPTSLDMVTVTTSGVTVSTTATINGFKIGYNNSEITIPNVTADADNIWLRTTGNNGAIMLTCLTSAGVKRNLAWANGRLRFDLSQFIYPNPADGSMTVGGGTTGGVDGIVSVKDWSGANDLLIEPGVQVRLLSTSTIKLAIDDQVNPGVEALIVNLTSSTFANNLFAQGFTATTVSAGQITSTDASITSALTATSITVTNLTANSTATIQGLKIGYNNSEITIPNVTADADNMWIRTTGNNGAIISTCLTSAGVKRNMAWANGRLRFDSYQTIYPNPTTGALTLQGGNDGSVDGPVQLQDYNGNNYVQIDPSQGVNIVTTATYQWYFTVEGMAQLPVVSAAPASPATGMMAVADAVTWNPATYSTTTPYVAFYNGTSWVALG